MVFKRGHNLRLGKKHLEETKRKISLSRKGIPSWNKGKKTGIIPKTSFKKGHIPWHKGKIGVYSEGQKRNMVKTRMENGSYKHSEETKKKISEGNKGKKIGEKNPSWKGGISIIPYTIDWTLTLKKSIRERDRYTCQMCGQEGIEVHHIDYNKENCNPTNLITLCKSCHAKTNNNRNFWEGYLNNKKFMGENI